MDAAVTEAASELSKLGLANLLRKDATRCVFLVGPEKQEILGCPSVINACCPKLAKWMLSEIDKPMRLPSSIVKVDAFKNIIQFMHTGTLDMCMLKDVNDYVDFVRANYFAQIPLLLQMSLRMLQPHVDPSNVWLVLIRLVHKQHLAAAVCDEVLTTKTRECLSSLIKSSFSSKMLIYFLKLDQMHISSEIELLKTFAQLKRGRRRGIIKSTAPRGLRFMSLSTENLSQALPLLENILAPDELQSVLLAIKAQDPSKLPENFKTSFRTLTNTNPVEKSEVENSNVSIKDKARTDSGPIQKLVSAAALESNNLRDSAVCPLVGNTFGEEIDSYPHYLEACSDPLEETLSRTQRQNLKKFNRDKFKSLVDGNLDVQTHLNSLGDYVDFLKASYDLKMLQEMKMSYDLLQMKINPKNVWEVLRRIGHLTELRTVCNKVLSEQTIECLQQIEQIVNRHAVSYLLSLGELNIDSEIQLLQAFEKIKIVHEGKRYCMMRTVANNLRFMTLSIAELESIKSILQKFLTDKEYKAVYCAVKFGDCSKLPQRFSTSCKKRKRHSIVLSAQPLESAPAVIVAEDSSKKRIQILLDVIGDKPVEGSSKSLLQNKKMPTRKAEDESCHETVKKESISREINLDKIMVKSEPPVGKTKKLKRQLLEEDEIKQELSEEPEMKVAAKKSRKILSQELSIGKNDSDQELLNVKIAEKTVEVRKQVHLKEESGKEERVPVASKIFYDEVVKVKQEQSDQDKDAKKKCTTNKLKVEKQLESSNQLWEFIETKGTIQVRRKHPKLNDESSKEELGERTKLQIKNEPVNESDSKRQTIKLTSLVHFELLQDSAQLTRSVHHVQSEAEKVIMRVKVLEDLQLLGVELSARTDDSKLTNKYKKSRSNEMYEEALEVSVFSSTLGMVFKSTVQGQRAYNSRLVINASSMPVLPQGSKLRVKVTVPKGAAYRTVSSIAFKGADAVLAKTNVQHKVLENGAWIPVDRDEFCPITRLFLKVQN